MLEFEDENGEALPDLVITEKLKDSSSVPGLGELTPDGKALIEMSDPIYATSSNQAIQALSIQNTDSNERLRHLQDFETD